MRAIRVLLTIAIVTAAPLERATFIDAAPSTSGDPSRYTYTRIYCTPDSETHFQEVTVDLAKTSFAPPAAPIYLGGQHPASATFFVGAEAHWGTEDLKNGLNHPTPAAQFAVLLRGALSITTTDGKTRRFLPGDVLRLEDTAPCKGHISVNQGGTPGFVLFAR
jgi:hypothetical protein